MWKDNMFVLWRHWQLRIPSKVLSNLRKRITTANRSNCSYNLLIGGEEEEEEEAEEEYFKFSKWNTKTDVQFKSRFLFWKKETFWNWSVFPDYLVLDSNFRSFDTSKNPLIIIRKIWLSLETKKRFFDRIFAGGHIFGLFVCFWSEVTS